MQPRLRVDGREAVDGTSVGDAHAVARFELVDRDLSTEVEAGYSATGQDTKDNFR